MTSRGLIELYTTYHMAYATAMQGLWVKSSTVSSVSASAESPLLRSGTDLGERHRSLEELVTDELRSQILTGTLPSGSRLVPGDIAEALGVSRGPARAAIQKLAAEGLVEVTPRRGATVAQVTVKEALDCYEVRAALEGVAAQRAAEVATDQQLDAIADVIGEARLMMTQQRWFELAELNNRFHESLARASNNGELVVMMRHYAVRIAWIFSQSAEQRGSAAWDEHEAILDAVRSRKGVRASELSRAHIAASREKFLEIASERFAH